MKLFNSKIKKTLLFTTGSVLLALIVLLLLVSPLAKHLIQKYDVRFTGREISMEYAYVNPFTGYVYFHNVKIQEVNTDSLFLSVKGLSANFEMLKLFSKTFEISQITLDQPKGQLIIKKGKLNFDDVIKRFSPDSGAAPKPKLHLSILQIAILNGEFNLQENQVPVNYPIKKVNILCSGFRWDTDTISGTLSLVGGKTQGNLNGNFNINYKTMDYAYTATAKKFDLEIIDQYLKELVNFGTFRACLDANIEAKGNFKSKEDVVLKGLISINDLHFGKSLHEDYAAFDKLTVSITELSPKKRKYLIDSIILKHPYFNYERYDYLDNFSYMFGKKAFIAKNVKNDPKKFNLIIEVLRYVKVLVKNFFQSSYKVNKLEITDGCLDYEDYTLAEKFSLSTSSLHIYADSIDKNRKRAQLELTTKLEPYGKASLNLSINPQDSADFDLEYSVKNFPLTILNPYLVKYTSYPMDRGAILVKGSWHVRDGRIDSKNHLVVLDPRISERVYNKNNTWIPLRLAMYFVRERSNVIDYQIPISGELKDPNFHYKDVILDAIINTFSKPATVVQRTEVKENENEIEKSLTLKWNFLQETLYPEQINFLEELSESLRSDPTLSITIHPEPYFDKEKEYLLFFNAKKKYFLSLNNKTKGTIDEDDSLAINTMSNKDSSFVHYVNKQINDPSLFTLQDKCLTMVGATFINKEFNQLSSQRNKSFMVYFKELPNTMQVKIYKDVNKIPYNGFSLHRIEYVGKIPEKLRKANERMNEMNSESPRNKFRRLRNASKRK